MMSLTPPKVVSSPLYEYYILYSALKYCNGGCSYPHWKCIIIPRLEIHSKPMRAECGGGWPQPTCQVSFLLCWGGNKWPRHGDASHWARGKNSIPPIVMKEHEKHLTLPLYYKPHKGGKKKKNKNKNKKNRVKAMSPPLLEWCPVTKAYELSFIEYYCGLTLGPGRVTGSQWCPFHSLLWQSKFDTRPSQLAKALSTEISTTFPGPWWTSLR